MFISLINLIIFFGAITYSMLSIPMQVYARFITPPAGTIITPLPNTSNSIMEPIKQVRLPVNVPILNGSIIKDPKIKNQYLLTFRTVNDQCPEYDSCSGLLKLNQEWLIVDQQPLELKKNYNFYYADNYITRAEDARIFSFRGSLHVIYNGDSDDQHTDMFIANLKSADSNYQLENIHKLKFAESAKKRERNWTPFVYDDQLYVIYSFVPTVILKFNDMHKNFELAYQTNLQKHDQKLWKYGEIKGGTTAEYIPELNAYLTFFHSNKKYKSGQPAWSIRLEPEWRIYYMGAAVLEAKPPFRILAITEQPLTYDGLYSDKDKNYHIIFPCGFITREDDFIISAGIDDRELVLLKINKQKLYQHLTWLKDN